MEADGRDLRLSNLDKVFWPEEGYTKGDLLAYYWNVADLILPYLHGRPLTMKRMPDGADGPHFYEKTAPSHTPDWVHRCKVHSDDSKRGEIDYLMVDDTSTLLYVANLGCIEMHPLHSRCADVEHPDYLFFDLDPFEPYTFEDVLTVARHIKVVLDQLGLSGYPKTSGATGVQIYVPVEARRLHVRTGAGVRRCVRPDDRESRPGPRHDGVEDREPHRQGVHRPQHEPAGGQHRGRVLASGPSPARPSRRRSRGTRSSRVASSRRTSGSTTCGIGSRRSGTCSRGFARRRWTSPTRFEALGVQRRGRRAPTEQAAPRGRPRRPRRRRPRTRSSRRRRTRPSTNTSGGASSARRGRPSPPPATRRGRGTPS